MGYTPPYLEVRKVAGGWNMYAPTSTTGDDLIIYPNLTDTTAYVKIEGAGKVTIQSAGTLELASSGASGLLLTYLNPDQLISTISNRNIYLAPNGTGKVKFGTHTGSGDVACNGYIDILDSGGTARKLMTTA